MSIEDNRTLSVPLKNFDPRGHKVFSAYTPAAITVHRHPFGGSDVFLYDVVNTYLCVKCGDAVYWSWSEESGVLKASAKKSCSVDNVLPFEVTLAVPSGELIFGHTLFSDAFEPPEQDYATMSLNSAEGRKNFSKFYESFGVLTGRVNLRAPQLWYSAEAEELLVAAGVEDEEDEELKLPPSPGFLPFGSFAGAVWGFEVADKADFLARGGVIREDTLSASVKPGNYLFEIFGDLDKLNEIPFEEPVIYAAGKLVSS